MLMLNALAHHSSSAMKSAVASGTLRPTVDVVRQGPSNSSGPAVANASTGVRESGGGRRSSKAGPKLTALAIVLEPCVDDGIVDETRCLHGNVQRVRKAHDRNERRWPPHITLAYPFVPAAQFDEAAAALEAGLAAEGVGSFDMRFNGVQDFGHGRSFTAWTNPEPVAAAGASCPLQAVWRVARALYPDAGDQRGEFVPHLSLGQFTTQEEVDVFKAVVESEGWATPSEQVRVGEIHLLERRGDAGAAELDPFRVSRRIKLSHATGGWFASAGAAEEAPEVEVDTEAVVRELAAVVHSSFEKARKEKWASAIEAQNELVTAQQIVRSSTRLEFAGRLMRSAPTRGGGVYDAVVALLCDGTADTPHLESKVRAILTGKLCVDAPNTSAPAGYGSMIAASHEVLANGTSWIHCPLDVALLLREAIGEEAFLDIEVSMRGVSGWVYRESDMPNRHGHCNSNPNPKLTCRFESFVKRAEKERR